MVNENPIILITNDDGIAAKGINDLIHFIRPLGDLIVMAPDAPRSGTSSALTVTQPVHYELVSQEQGLTIYKCSGTPVDCVKMALEKVCARKPDLLIAGINHGDNSATNVYNSGTMGAVMEGCLSGLKSIAYSLCSHDPNANFEPTAPFIYTMTKWALQHELPPLTCLNVNFPDIPTFKGVKSCKMARGYWEHEFEPCPRRGDEHYFWLSGDYIELDLDNEPSDRWALSRGYIAVTPTKMDVTDYTFLDKLQIEMDHL
jgi:5'-nucleotidase